jgi:hypothetical protein
LSFPGLEFAAIAVLFDSLMVADREETGAAGYGWPLILGTETAGPPGQRVNRLCLTA